MNVVIVERDALVRADLEQLARGDHGIANVALADDMDAACHLASGLPGPVVLLLDLPATAIIASRAQQIVAEKTGGIVITHEHKQGEGLPARSAHWVFVERPFSTEMILSALAAFRAAR